VAEVGEGMSRSSDADARGRAFELEIEGFHLRIAALRDSRTLTAYVSRHQRRLWQAPGPGRVEVGTYTRTCRLEWFRADCFEALEGR
jgi:hypothetical protein